MSNTFSNWSVNELEVEIYLGNADAAQYLANNMHELMVETTEYEEAVSDSYDEGQTSGYEEGERTGFDFGRETVSEELSKHVDPAVEAMDEFKKKSPLYFAPMGEVYEMITGLQTQLAEHG